jgi:hypothetical protein
MRGAPLPREEQVEAPLLDSPRHWSGEDRPAAQPYPSPVRPFIVGTVVGGLAGAALGTVLSRHTRGFFVGLYHMLSRRLNSTERDQLRFELLLQ